MENVPIGVKGFWTMDLDSLIKQASETGEILNLSREKLPASLSYLDLSKAILVGISGMRTCVKTNFASADLQNANFHNALLDDAVFSSANLGGIMA